MATSILTHKTSAPQGVNRTAGRIGAAVEYFNIVQSVDDGRKLSASEQVERISLGLPALVERLQRIEFSLEALAERMAENGDQTQELALLEVVRSYHTETCTRAFDLGGLMVAALERANESPTSDAEVSHA